MAWGGRTKKEGSGRVALRGRDARNTNTKLNDAERRRRASWRKTLSGQPGGITGKRGILPRRTQVKSDELRMDLLKKEL